MKVLIDTNIALDILLHRQGYINSALIFSFSKRNIIEGYISASAITDIFFLRNTKDYSSGSIPAVSPEDFLKTITVE